MRYGGDHLLRQIKHVNVNLRGMIFVVMIMMKSTLKGISSRHFLIANSFVVTLV